MRNGEARYQFRTAPVASWDAIIATKSIHMDWIKAFFECSITQIWLALIERLESDIHEYNEISRGHSALQVSKDERIVISRETSLRTIRPGLVWNAKETFCFFAPAGRRIQRT